MSANPIRLRQYVPPLAVDPSYHARAHKRVACKKKSNATRVHKGTGFEFHGGV